MNPHPTKTRQIPAPAVHRHLKQVKQPLLNLLCIDAATQGQGLVPGTSPHTVPGSAKIATNKMTSFVKRKVEFSFLDRQTPGVHVAL